VSALNLLFALEKKLWLRFNTVRILQFFQKLNFLLNMSKDSKPLQHSSFAGSRRYDSPDAPQLHQVPKQAVDEESNFPLTVMASNKETKSQELVEFAIQGKLHQVKELYKSGADLSYKTDLEVYCVSASPSLFFSPSNSFTASDRDAQLCITQ